MSRRVQVVFDCAHPPAMTAFWAQALGYVEEAPPPGFDSWPAALEAWGVPESELESKGALVDPEGVGPRLFFQRVPEPRTVKNRVHLDVRASERTDPAPQREAAVLAAVERLEAVGGTRLDWVEELGTHFMVMRDVEGNEFCVT